MPPYNPNDYVTVQQRIDKFWEEHPNGAIQTEVVGYATDLGSVIVRAMVYRDLADAKPCATGLAQEHHNGTGARTANTTHWVENCETSAIGRALANMSYETSLSRPSREEMAKMDRYDVPQVTHYDPSPVPPMPAAPPVDRVSTYQRAREEMSTGNGATPNQNKAIYAIIAKLGWDKDDLEEELNTVGMTMNNLTRQSASGIIKYLDDLQNGAN